MTIKNTIKQEINQVLRDLFELTGIDFSVDYPPSAEMGDYSSNVAMVLAKSLKKNPMEVAREITEALKHLNTETLKHLKTETLKNLNTETLKHGSTGAQKHSMFQRIEVMKPGFVNLYLSQEWLQKQLRTVLEQGEKFGTSTEGNGKNIVLDYSAPNIAKKMHVGHLPSTVIGAAIYNLYKFLGYNVVRDNHLGDWGTQFGKMIYEYKQVYGEELKPDITVDEMEKLYLDFHEQAKTKPEMEDGAREELKKLQDKEEFNFNLWKLFCEKSIEEFKRVYKLLDVDFELWNGESFYHDKLAEVVREAKEKKVARTSEGAVIIDLEQYNLPPLMIQKSDGAYLYGTSDLATIKYRWKNYEPVKNLYVVANQQALHFEQLFKAGELLGLTRGMEMAHIKFGLILGKNGKKMSTRAGGVVDLLEVINDGIEKAKKRIQEKNRNLNDNELEKIARQVAIGAIKYNDVSQNRLTDIIFDWDRMLSFESGSSPYLQYTYVRIRSIFRMAGKTRDCLPADATVLQAGDATLLRSAARDDSKLINFSLLKEEKELGLIKQLLKFPEVAKAAADEYKPNLIANYLENLAGEFHSFYEAVPILKAKKELKAARLKLIAAVGMVMKSGLGLLGIECPEKM